MDDADPAKEESLGVSASSPNLKWLVRGWADENLGLEPSGRKLPQTTRSLEGEQDFELSAVRDPKSEIAVEPFHASDYFEQFYVYATQLVRSGKAYVT